MARTNKDIKHIGLRVSPELWTRIADAAWSVKISTQAFCIGAIEKRLGRAENKPVAIAGPSVRTEVDRLRKTSVAR